MESQRSFLIIALIFVSYLLWEAWQLDYNAPKVPVSAPVTASQSAVPANGTDNSDVPASASAQPSAENTAMAADRQITVETDVLQLIIDTKGGDVVDVRLREHTVELGSEELFQLMANTPGNVYVAQSGLIGRDGPDGRVSGRPEYTAAQREYQLAEGADTLSVPLTFTGENGLQVTKTFTFTRGSYHVAVDTQVANQGETPAQVQLYAQLKQTITNTSRNLAMPTYRGGAYSSDEERYQKLSFDDMKKSNLSQMSQAGWVGMLEHYFVSAWVPAQDQNNQLYSRVLNGDTALIGYKGPVTEIQPGQQASLKADLFAGPKDKDQMNALNNTLALSRDYGFLWMIAQPLSWLLSLFQKIVVNWGLAIIALTLTVRGAMYPLTKAQYTSMAKMRKLQPQLTALRERFGDDRQKMSQAMMELYKKEKANPLGGCLPLLIQMPIFIALYWVLMEAVELRHAPFMLWIDDLSSKDPYFILPILMGASMWLMQKMQPTTITDPMQQKVMQLMPVVFTVFFLWFPSGLVLYWLTSNLLSIGQSWWIYRQMDKAEAAAQAK